MSAMNFAARDAFLADLEQLLSKHNARFVCYTGTTYDSREMAVPVETWTFRGEDWWQDLDADMACVTEEQD